MKLISGETHRKQIRRIESLEQQVENLTALSSALEAERAGLDEKWRDAEEKLAQSNNAQAALQAALEQSKAELTTSLQLTECRSNDLEEAIKSLAVLQAQLTNLRLDLQQTHAELKAQVQVRQQSEQKLAEQRATALKLQGELKSTNEKLAHSQRALKASEEHSNKQSADREQLHSEIAAQKSKLQALDKTYQELQVKHEEAALENELLLQQLMQAQEEIVEYHDERKHLQNTADTLKARWARLERRHPDYVDYGSLELIGYDVSSEIPSLTWRLKDYVYVDAILPEFTFRLALQDGHPGLGLVCGESCQASRDSTFVPRLLGTRRLQTDQFLRMTSTEHRQLTAALVVLAQMEASQWQGVDLPQALDIAFWRDSLKQLIDQWAALPPTLRYDSVKLKRELIHTDYEHLWLELNGVSFDKQSWKKFEIRLGAALVEPGGFSKFPKFEIPLIGGEKKPFESWYAESRDDMGDKLELRFGLEKSVFDAAVLSRLAAVDRDLVLRLVYAMPSILQQLEHQKVAIHRSWKTWIDFAAGALKIVELSRIAALRAVKVTKVPKPPELQPSEKVVQVTKAPRPTPEGFEESKEPQTRLINIPPSPKKPASKKRSSESKNPVGHRNSLSEAP